MTKSIFTPKFSLFLFWLTLTIVWGGVKVLRFSEIATEIFLKPGIWVGLAVLFWQLKLLPRNSFSILRQQYLNIQPIWKAVVLPLVVTIAYFGVSNFRNIQIPPFSISLLTYVVIINFSTAIVEEFVYRGILFIQLKRFFELVPAFIITQILFVMSHIPTLLLNSTTFQDGLIHLTFILILSCLYTAFFNYSKSLYSSILSHGMWNFLVHYFVLGAI